MKSLLILTTAIVALSSASLASAKTIDRHCSGTIFMTSYSDSPGRHFQDVELDGDITGRGECGSAVPNRCRERARNAIKNCFAAATKNPDAVPPECKDLNKIPQYEIGTLRGAARQHFCQLVDYRNQNHIVDFTLKTSGDKKCPGTTHSHARVAVSTLNCER